MFENAIKNVSEFTRPIHAIFRIFTSKEIYAKAATIFFINELGDAITTMGTVEDFFGVESRNSIYTRYKTEKSRKIHTGEEIEELEKKYGYTFDSIVELKTMFIDCVSGSSNFEIIPHLKYNLALLRFPISSSFQYQGFAKFIKSTEELPQGKHLCRLGYSFPYINNYFYNEQLDEIDWKADVEITRTLFPIDGIVTRLLKDSTQIMGFEMSTPGYEGHEGSPLFDSDGAVYGMHIGNRSILENRPEAQERSFNFPPALLGECLDAQTIKEFLRVNNVKFYEVDNGEIIVNDEIKTENPKPTNPFPINMIPAAFIAADKGESAMTIHSIYMEVGGFPVVNYHEPLQLTTGKVDSGSRTAGATSIQFSTEGDNRVFIKEEGAARTSHLAESRNYKLEVQQRKLSSEKWKVRASVKTQEKFPFEYFDLLIIRRHGHQRNHVKDPHITFYPDGGGKYIRYDNDKNIQINTTKIIDGLNTIVLPQETSIQTDEFEVKVRYAFKSQVLSITKIELLDK